MISATPTLFSKDLVGYRNLSYTRRWWG